MADFTTVANEAVTKLTTFINQCEQTKVALGESQASFIQVAEQTDSNWLELSQQATSLVERFQSAKQELAIEHQTVFDTLTELKSKLQAFQEQAEQDMQEAQEIIGSIDDELSTIAPELQEEVQESENDSDELVEAIGELVSEFETAVSRVEGFIQDEVSDDLNNQQMEIDQKVSQLKAKLAEAEAALEAKVAELDTHLHSLDGEITTELQEAGDSIEKIAQDKTETAWKSLHDSMDKLPIILMDLYGIIDYWNRVSQQRGEQVDQLSEVLDQAAKKVCFMVTMAIGILKDIIAIRDKL